MKIDIISPPPPLTFGEGDNKFQLHLKRFTGGDRAAVLDAMVALENPVAQINHAIERIIETWSGVCDTGGNPIQMIVKDDAGNETNLLGKFLGALPAEMHLAVLSGILAFMDIPDGIVDRMAKVFKSSKNTKTDPTAPPAADTPTIASGDSSNSET